jgi:hypothetical protein
MSTARQRSTCAERAGVRRAAARPVSGARGAYGGGGGGGGAGKVRCGRMGPQFRPILQVQLADAWGWGESQHWSSGDPGVGATVVGGSAMVLGTTASPTSPTPPSARASTAAPPQTAAIVLPALFGMRLSLDLCARNVQSRKRAILRPLTPHQIHSGCRPMRTGWLRWAQFGVSEPESAVANPFRRGESIRSMTVIRAELARRFYFGDDEVLLVTDTDGVKTLESDGTVHDFLIEPAAADIELHGDRVIWRLDHSSARRPLP